jgi:hypothetical protein
MIFPIQISSRVQQNGILKLEIVVSIGQVMSAKASRSHMSTRTGWQPSCQQLLDTTITTAASWILCRVLILPTTFASAAWRPMRGSAQLASLPASLAFLDDDYQDMTCCLIAPCRAWAVSRHYWQLIGISACSQPPFPLRQLHESGTVCSVKGARCCIGWAWHCW